MKDQNFDKDVNYLLRELKRFEPFGIKLDRKILFEDFRATRPSRYELLTGILLYYIKKKKGNNDFLSEAYRILYTRGKKEEDPKWFEYFKLFTYHIVLGKVKNAPAKEHKLLLDCSDPCGKCNHLVNKFIDLDITLSTLPYPVRDCLNEQCSAFSVIVSKRYVEKNDSVSLSNV